MKAVFFKIERAADAPKTITLIEQSMVGSHVGRLYPDAKSDFLKNSYFVDLAKVSDFGGAMKKLKNISAVSEIEIPATRGLVEDPS